MTDPKLIADWGWAGDETCGKFMVPMKAQRVLPSGLLTHGITLSVIASVGGLEEGHEAWDHVSVSLPNRCPTWDEMDFIKRLFFLDTETAMQLHVPASDHISVHPYCLHLWRPHVSQIPRPPSIMVGIK